MKSKLGPGHLLLKAASFLVEPSRFMGVRGSMSRSSSAGASTAVGVVVPDADILDLLASSVYKILLNITDT